MKLTSKLVPLVASLGLAGLTSCAEMEEMSDAFYEQMIYQTAAVKLDEKGEHGRAQAMRNMGAVAANRKIAEAGRSEVNVNVNTDRSGRTTEAGRSRSEVNVYNGGGNWDKGWAGIKGMRVPDYIIRTSEGYRPATGYEWIDPRNIAFGVRRKSSTNNVRGNSEQRSNGEVPSFFVSNYWTDLNGNGRPETGEIVGFMGGNKRDFNQGESISFWIQHYVGHERLPIKFKILNPQGEEVYSKLFLGTEKGTSHQIPNSSGFPSNYFEDKGTHIASYSINRKFTESIQFNIN